MRYVAAYCLAALQGAEPSSKDLEKILSSVGIDCDASNAKKVVDELKGKKMDSVIAEGLGKLGSVPVSSGAAPSGNVKEAKPAAAAAEPKKEEKKEEPEEESDEDMGFGLFD